jgi:hypothetical protein
LPVGYPPIGLSLRHPNRSGLLLHPGPEGPIGASSPSTRSIIVGFIARFDADEPFRSEASMALALRMAMAGLIPGSAIVKDIFADEEAYPDERSTDFAIVRESDGRAMQVFVADVDKSLYKLISLAGEIGIGKALETLEAMKDPGPDDDEDGDDNEDEPEPEPNPVPSFPTGARFHWN